MKAAKNISKNAKLAPSEEDKSDKNIELKHRAKMSRKNYQAVDYILSADYKFSLWNGRKTKVKIDKYFIKNGSGFQI